MNGIEERMWTSTERCGAGQMDGENASVARCWAMEVYPGYIPVLEYCTDGERRGRDVPRGRVGIINDNNE